MCKIIEIGRDAVPSNIVIEFQRDASIRGTEVLIFNRDRNGHDVHGVKLTCYDNGKIEGGPETHTYEEGKKLPIYKVGDFGTSF